MTKDTREVPAIEITKTPPSKAGDLASAWVGTVIPIFLGNPLTPKGQVVKSEVAFEQLAKTNPEAAQAIAEAYGLLNQDGTFKRDFLVFAQGFFKLTIITQTTETTYD